VIDTSGMTMMPGLIDLHAHLMILGHGDYDIWFPEYIPRLDEVLPISARQLLLAGVTTAVDLGAPLEPILRVRDRINRGEIPGPRMLVSGPWVTRSLGRWSDDFQMLVDTPEQAAAATRRLCEAGVDVIKAYVGLQPAHYQAIVDTAHEFGVQVHAHVYSPTDIRNALEAGVDVLQHVGSAGTPPYSDELISAIAVAGRPVVPTAAHRVWLFPDTVAFPDRLQDQRLRADFPAEIYREVQDSLRDFHTLSYFATTDRQMFYGEAHMRKWLESGAVIGIGTDSGTPMNFHTEAMWREMKVFVDLGMSPQKVISAATRINARILGRGRELGTVEAGKLADIFVVQGNPLLSITALDRVVHVVKDGVAYRRPGGQAR
jgi:imidazolonepropionase-like amidohydrolase